MNSPEHGQTHERPDGNLQLFERATRLIIGRGNQVDEADSAAFGGTIHTFVIDRQSPGLEPLFSRTGMRSVQVWPRVESADSNQPPIDARVDFAFADDDPRIIKIVSIGRDAATDEMYDVVSYSVLPRQAAEYTRQELDEIWLHALAAIEERFDQTPEQREYAAAMRLWLDATEDSTMTLEDRDKIVDFLRQLETWFGS